MTEPIFDAVYSNAGNRAVVEAVPPFKRLLDVGCGAGDNARLLKQRFPEGKVFGITRSRAEADLARDVLSDCWVVDVESDFAKVFDGKKFDVVLCSHVLEHLVSPENTVAKLAEHLQPNGCIVIAVPNVANWRMRWRFLLGRFEYEPHGVMDETHLRFYSYLSADRLLVRVERHMAVEWKGGDGGGPLWMFRRFLLPTSWSTAIDQYLCRRWPNLFTYQVIIRARSLAE
jgi:SAM-dependent methyltransferase